jgi:hypothetical protein
MNEVDDGICRQILEVAANRWNSWSNLDELRHIADGHALGQNAEYLENEGLVEVRWRRTGERDMPFGPIKITQKGFNFLRRDGGLAATEQVITVRLHDDTLKALLELAIQRAPETEPGQKERVKQALRELPAETTKSLALQRVDAALRSGWSVLHLL